MSAAEPERRLTPTERLHEISMAAIQRSAAPPEHTATIARNFKGHYTFEVTVRGTDVDAVVLDAVKQAALLDARYPFGNGGET